MKHKKTIFCLMMVLTFSLLFASVASATDSVSHEETYETDTAGADPSASWYTYGDSGIQWANVTDSDAYAGSQSFLMNTTSDTSGGALYDVVDSSYEFIELDVKIDTSQHNFSMITVGTWIDHELYTGHGAFCFWRIGTYDGGENYNIDFHVITTTEGNVTTEIYNESINNNTWYRLRAEFNYDNYQVTGKIYNEEGVAGTPVLMASDSATCSIPFTNITQSFWAIPENTHGADSCYIFFDDFTLGTIYSESAGEIINEFGLGTYLVMMGLSVLTILVVAFMFKSGSVDIDFIFMLLLIFILIAVTMGVLFSI